MYNGWLRLHTHAETGRGATNGLALLLLVACCVDEFAVSLFCPSLAEEVVLDKVVFSDVPGVFVREDMNDDAD